MKEVNSKIHDLEKIQKAQTGIKKNRNHLEQKPDFQQILADKVNPGSKKTVFSDTVSSLPELENNLIPSFEKKHLDNRYFPDRIENILDMLDTYSLWLSDTNKTLKSVFPLLNDLEEKITTIDKEINEDTDSDARLKQIVAQLLTTINLEKIKMQKGDYLDT